MHLTTTQKIFRSSLNKVCFFVLASAAALLIVVASACTASAQGNLLISPRRIVFEGSRRTAELNLANTGKDTAKYVMSTMEIHMKEDGSFEIIEASDSVGPSFATPYIRFFPRSVILGPNEAQTVKMQVVRASELNVGEYRSHLYFRAITDPHPLGDSTAKKDSTVTVSLKPTFGISIPVIIRIGENNTQTTLSDIAFKGGEEPGVQLMINRNGNMSVYGNLQVEHVAQNGAVTNVGLAKGLAVYTCINRRQFSLPLDKSAGVDFKNGVLRFTYTEDASNGATLAQGELKLDK